MKRIYLYYIAAALWGIPGVIITVKGLKAYLNMPQDKLWWLILITALVFAGFFFYVFPDSGQILGKDSGASRKDLVLAYVSAAGMGPDCVYVLPWSGSEVYSRHSGRVHSIILFRSWSDAPLRRLQVYQKE